MEKRLSGLRRNCCVVILTLLVTNPLWADDIEIFFGRSSNTDVQPNVLFVLDGSGSMAWYDCANGNIQSSSCNDGTPNGTTTRLNRLKDSLKTVLNNTSNINIGLMRFSHSNSGGRITYPIRAIDQQICGGQPCDNNQIFETQSRTSISEDDALQIPTGEVTTADAALTLAAADSVNNEHWIGLRFPDLKIPQGASITDARIDFTSTMESTAGGSLIFHAEDTDNSIPFDTTNNSISQRNRSYNTVSWNGIPAWNDGGNYESPNVASLLQNVINKTAWCGGNAFGLIIKGTGERQIAASDVGAGTSPVLRVSYKLDQVPAGGGCTKATVLTKVTTGNDDATELNYNGASYGTGLNYTALPVAQSTYRSYGYDSAVRFASVDIPRNASIVSAEMTFIPQNYGWFSSYPTVKISAHDSATPAALQSTNNNISSRPETTVVEWDNIPTVTNVEATTPSLIPIVQGLVNKTDWDSGNPMVFMLKQSGSGGHNFVSYNGDPTKAAQLKIEFQTYIQSVQDTISGPVTDVKSEIIAELDSMVAYHGTPTVGALLEAKRYFTGQNVKYGLNRYSDSRYTTSPYYWGRYSRVSTPDSYTGGNVVRSASCNINAPDGQYCATENITGQPVYISPFTSECQSNHIVLLTDGVPNADTAAEQSVRSITGGSCVDQTDSLGTCGEEIAEYMNTTDQFPNSGDQFITTHTIGFNFTTQWLKDVASAGGGGYYTADTADQLSSALTNIIGSVQNDSAMFVAPGITVDNYSKVSHRNDIYLALFQPRSSPDWSGNLKRYDFSGNPASLHDANLQPAVDGSTGTFFDTAQSFWSDTADGNTVAAGGAASRIHPPTRKLYTNIGSSNDLTHSSNKFSPDNSLITALKLGLYENEDSSRSNIIKWALGYDVKDDDGDDNTEESRFHIGDPLHSKPILLNYSGTSTADQVSVVYFGTNDGFLHAINSVTGDEEFSFIPSALIPNLKMLYDSNPATDKVYGLDGTLSLWLQDNNNNGIIEAGDQALLYAGMRRGGHNYYALDVSDKDDPKLKWHITNQTSGFEELGQTWSQAVPTYINYLGSKTKVLVFGGGYDVSQDDHSTRNIDGIGRALYIVDAEDGTLLWSGGPADGSETQSFDDMTYSFPATPKLIDSNGDGMAEQIYIGDMGGRIWRFDLNDTATDAANLYDGGVVADLGTDGIAADTRRFYHTPDISVSTVDGTKMVNIAAGSGYQAHPLDTTIEDRFFLIRLPFELPIDSDGNGLYGIPDSTTSLDESGQSYDYVPLQEDDLFDATSNILGQGSNDDKLVAEAQLAASHGWFIRMERVGEKVLGSSVTFDNRVMFASYVPGNSPNGCSPEIGHGIFWAVNLWDATPVAPLDSDDEDNLTKENRNTGIPGGGIPAPVQVIFVQADNSDDSDDDNDMQILAISGANAVLPLDNNGLIKRVYWSEYPNF